MALNQKEIMAYGKLGAIAGLATGFLLKTISQLVSMISGVSLDLQSISVQTTGLGGLINTGMGEYAKKLFGLVPIHISGMEFVYTAIGGALFVILGAYVADMAGLLKGEKTTRLAWVFVFASVITGWILSMSINIPAFSTIIVLGVDAMILAWILGAADKSLKTNLIP